MYIYWQNNQQQLTAPPGAGWPCDHFKNGLISEQFDWSGSSSTEYNSAAKTFGKNQDSAFIGKHFMGYRFGNGILESDAFKAILKKLSRKYTPDLIGNSFRNATEQPPEGIGLLEQEWLVKKYDKGRGLL